jgi:hypothetical protein
MGLHENFRDYTPEEINKIKTKVCGEHKCPYLGTIWENQGKSNKKYSDYSNRCCNYYIWTGKRRDCMPDDCTHYNDTFVKKKRGDDIYYGRERNVN